VRRENKNIEDMCVLSPIQHGMLFHARVEELRQAVATQVVNRIHTTFGVELSLRALFDAPTVSDLAKRVEEVSW
jgi:Phosphopantetheine attachment site